jgi:hypothetical protein
MTEAAARWRWAMRVRAGFAAAALACVWLSTPDANAEEGDDPLRLRLHLRASVGAFYGYTQTRSVVVVDDTRATTLARFPAVYSGIGAGGELGVGLASRRVAFGLLWSGQLTPQHRLGSAASAAGLRASSSELLERSSLGPFLEARFDPLLLGGSLGWTSVPARPCCIAAPDVELSKLDAGYEGLSAGLWLGFEKALGESYSYRLTLRSDFLFNDLLQITADRHTTSMALGMMIGITRR